MLKIIEQKDIDKTDNIGYKHEIAANQIMTQCLVSHARHRPKTRAFTFKCL